MLETLAQKIADEVKDYRQADGISISTQSVIEWAEQFPLNDREFLLEETFHILDQRYMPKAFAEKSMKVIIEKLTEDLKYSDVADFLHNTVFLDLQGKEKSQKDLLRFVANTLEKEYNFDMKECGTVSEQNFIYLDDVLCTGNTVFLDITRWLNEDDGEGNTRLQKIRANKCKVIFVHVFVHKYNRHKLEARFRHFNRNFSYTSYKFLEVENDFQRPDSKLDFAFPIKEGQPQIVLDYFTKLNVAELGVFRQPEYPKEEKFFSSPENRVRYENLILIKGLEILSSVNNAKEHMRPLGYTLPSHKTFGFGALCFTWRNIANNTPLVFWYSSGNWKPLFEKKSYDPFPGLSLLFR